MFLIVGLGNPGEKYSHTRHNIGYLVVDHILSLLSSETEDPIRSFHLDTYVHAETVNVAVSGKKVLLAKPVTFMNESGKAVKKINTKYEIRNTNDIVVIHDDISMELGQVKISRGAGAGKHNGVQSIIDHLGTNEFIRVRCGIGRGTGILSDVVLSSFRPDEKQTVDTMIQKASEAVMTIITDGVEKAMSTHNASSRVVE